MFTEIVTRRHQTLREASRLLQSRYPVGEYNPDLAIVKHEGQALYFVKETKSPRDLLKLRTTEADKVCCGQRHFETLSVPFLCQ
jgi:restriction endonuclease